NSSLFPTNPPGSGVANEEANVRGRSWTRTGGLMVAGALASACSSPGGIPWSGDGALPPTTLVESPSTTVVDGEGFHAEWTTGGAAGQRASAGVADAPSRVCATSAAFRADGVRGRSGSALLVSGSGAPEPGDAPVRDRLEQMGFLVTVKDDDLMTASDAAGMELVLISESASSTTIGSTFTPLAVPIMVWERQLFSELKMSEESNWHTDPQDTIVVSDPSLTCGVTGEVTVVTTDAYPMTRARPPASANVAA